MPNNVGRYIIKANYRDTILDLIPAISLQAYERCNCASLAVLRSAAANLDCGAILQLDVVGATLCCRRRRSHIGAAVAIARCAWPLKEALLAVVTWVT